MPKTILITGASTGLGAETARLLAPENEIFVHYNASEAAARKVAEEVAEVDGKAHLIQADLTTESGCRELVQTVSEKTDKLDVLKILASLITPHWLPGMVHRLPPFTGLPKGRSVCSLWVPPKSWRQKSGSMRLRRESS